MQIDDSDNAVLYALDPATGKTVWQKRRTVGESWASPIIVISGNREMVVLAENPTATAYDVNTGAVVLSTECLGGEVTPSPAYARGTMIVANEQAELTAISLASGTVAWSGEDDGRERQAVKEAVALPGAHCSLRDAHIHVLGSR